MSDDDKITQVAKAVEGIVKAVPVYEDAIRPAAREIGKELEIITKSIQIALAPISVLVWGYGEIKNFVEAKISEKLKNIPLERIQTPSPLVAGPIVEALRYAGHEETLRELYINLLATSIDSETAKNAHPGFVAILQNMSPDEAKIIRLFASEGSFPLIDVKANIKSGGFRVLSRNFSLIGKKTGCVYLELTPNYLDNLLRLGLVEIPPNRYIMADELYEKLEAQEEVEKIKQQIALNSELTFSFDKKKVELTDLGKQFCLACVVDKNIS